MKTKRQIEIEKQIEKITQKIDSFKQEIDTLNGDDLEAQELKLMEDIGYNDAPVKPDLTKLRNEIQKKITRKREISRLISIGESKINALNAELEEANKESERKEFNELKAKAKEKVIAYNDKVLELQSVFAELQDLEKQINPIYYKLFDTHKTRPLSMVMNVLPAELSRPYDVDKLASFPHRCGIQIPDYIIGMLSD